MDRIDIFLQIPLYLSFLRPISFFRFQLCIRDDLHKTTLKFFLSLRQKKFWLHFNIIIRYSLSVLIIFVNRKPFLRNELYAALFIFIYNNKYSYLSV